MSCYILEICKKGYDDVKGYVDPLAGQVAPFSLNALHNLAKPCDFHSSVNNVLSTCYTCLTLL